MLANVANYVKSVSSFFKRQDVYIALLIILVGGSSFGLGRLSVIPDKNTDSVRIDEVFKNTELLTSSSVGENSETPTQNMAQGAFVGSRNSDKYHFPWCPGAQRIKEENKVWFASREEAENAGYTPAGNCKGL